MHERKKYIEAQLDGSTESNLKQEFKNILKVGFVKEKDYKKILRGNLSNRVDENLKIPKQDITSREITTLKEDKNYVKTLGNFDSKLPKLGV